MVIIHMQLECEYMCAWDGKAKLLIEQSAVSEIFLLHGLNEKACNEYAYNFLLLSLSCLKM